MSPVQAHAIDTLRMKQIWSDGTDERGNLLAADVSGEVFPLRCCLRRSEPGERIALISYAPLLLPSPWAETGPVFVHLDPCDGYDADGLPTPMRTGARVLRSYRRDRSLDYDGIVVTSAGEDIEAALTDLLADHRRHEVHVRALAEQCFTYRVTRSGEQPLG